MRPGSVLLIALLGCGPEPSPSSTPSPTKSDPPAAASPTPANAAPMPPSEPTALTRSLNDFAFDFHAAVELEGNTVVSPLSIALAFGMLVPGARGQTQREIVDRLGPGMEPDALTSQLGALFRDLDAPKEHVRFAIADRFFGDQALQFEPAYLDVLEQTFAAPLERIDFKSPEPARVRINTWVEERTERRIADLLPPGSLDASTAFVLVNAVYFQADWAVKFPENATSPGVFHAVAGDRNVPMMRLQSEVRYHRTSEGDDATQIVVLPYADERFAFAIVLPPKGSPALQADQWSTWIQAAARRRVQLSLPRFTVTTPDSIRLEQPLRKLGIRTAWTPSADFSGISPRLRLSEAYHKGFIEVNERGTEAAAATAVVGKRMSLPNNQIVVAVDRPFYFFVFDTRSELIVFMGRVEDPSV